MEIPPNNDPFAPICLAIGTVLRELAEWPPEARTAEHFLIRFDEVVDFYLKKIEASAPLGHVSAVNNLRKSLRFAAEEIAAADDLPPVSFLFPTDDYH